MITVGHPDGSVVEYGPIRTVQPATGGPRYTDYGERVVVPPRSHATASERPTPPPDMPPAPNGATMPEEPAE
jgi:hypothetical protein